MHRPMPNCCLHSVNACSASLCHPCVITISHSLLRSFNPSPPYRYGMDGRGCSRSPFGFEFCFVSFPSSRHHNLLPTLDTFISTCSLLFFWVIKSKFTVHVLAHVMDGVSDSDILLDFFVESVYIFIDLFTIFYFWLVSFVSWRELWFLDDMVWEEGGC
ncbi:hypothetical protein HDV57DRAFT_186663 [Trichoderma longibrachiatum]